MTNVWPNQQFVTVPMLVAEVWHKLTTSEQRLFFYLCTMADKHSAVELHVPAYIIRDYTGLDEKTIAKAGKGLGARELVRVSKGLNGFTRYELLDPRTHCRLPRPKKGEQQFTGIYIHRPQAGRSARTSRAMRKLKTHAMFRQPAWEELHQADQNRTALFPSVSGEFPCGVGNSAPEAITNIVEKAEFTRLGNTISEETMKREYLKRQFVSGSTTKTKLTAHDGTKLVVDNDAMTPERQDEIATALAENPMVRRLQEKFETRVVGIVDYKTGKKYGDKLPVHERVSPRKFPREHTAK